MRYDKEVAWKFFGDIAKAQQYIPQARTAAGEIFSANVNELEQVTRRVQLAEGVWCQVKQIPGQVVIEIVALPAQQAAPGGKVAGFILKASDGKEGILQKTDTGWVWVPKAQLTELAYGNVITWMDETRVLSCNGTIERCSNGLGGNWVEDSEIFLNGRAIEDLPALNKYLGASYYENNLYVVGTNATENLVVCSKTGESWNTTVVMNRSGNFYDIRGCALFDDAGEYARILVESSTNWRAQRVIRIKVGLIPSATIIHTDTYKYGVGSTGAPYNNVICSKTEDAGSTEVIEGDPCDSTIYTGYSINQSSQCDRLVFNRTPYYLNVPSNFVFAFSDSGILTFGTYGYYRTNWYRVQTESSYVITPYSFTSVQCDNGTNDCIANSVGGTVFSYELVNYGLAEWYHKVSSPQLDLVGERLEVYEGETENTREFESTTNICPYSSITITNLCESYNTANQYHTQFSKITWGYDPRCSAWLYSECLTYTRRLLTIPAPAGVIQQDGVGTSRVMLRLPSGQTIKLADISVALGYFCINAFVGSEVNGGTSTSSSTSGECASYLINPDSCGRSSCENYSVTGSTGAPTDYIDEWGAAFFPRMATQQNSAFMSGGLIDSYVFQGNADCIKASFQCNKDSAGRWLISVFLKIQEFGWQMVSGTWKFVPLPGARPIYVCKTVLTDYENNPTDIMNVEPFPDPDNEGEFIPPYFENVSVTGPRTL
jgi:hypothetical protein